MEDKHIINRFPCQIITLLFGLNSVFTACVSLEPVSPSSLAKVDVEVLTPDELNRLFMDAQSLLIELIKTKSINPEGHEEWVTQLISAKLNEVGIQPHIQYFCEGRANVYALLSPESIGQETGTTQRSRSTSDSGPICLLSHSDVVPAHPEGWSVPPFEGLIKEGYLYGRGALDMKGITALHLAAFRWIKQRVDRGKLRLKRGLAIIVVGDEEVDNLGMISLTQEKWDELNCAYVLNEGAFGVKDLLSKGQDVMPISVGEKGVLWVKLKVEAKAGHGSVPRASFAPHILLSALERIRNYEAEPVISEALTELFHAIGEDLGGLRGFILKRPLLTRWFALGDLLEAPEAAAAITHTFHITGINVHTHKPNVVPAEASALIDIRVRSGVAPEGVLDTLKRVIGDSRVEIEVLHSEASEISPWRGDPIYEALVRQTHRVFPSVVIGPATSVGFTDSTYARQKGARAYGWAPLLLSKEELTTMHGIDERLSLEQLKKGLDALTGVLLEIVVDSRQSPSSIHTSEREDAETP